MLAGKITAWCVKQNAVSEEQAVAVTYGIELLFDTLFKLIGLVLLGVVFGRLFETLVSIACFSSLRFFAGGAHMKTSLGCFASMVFVGAVSCLGAEWIKVWPVAPLVALSVGIVLLNAAFAPFFTRNNPLEERAARRKRIGATVYSALLVTGLWLVPSLHIRLLMLIPVTIQSLSILPCWHIGVNK